QHQDSEENVKQQNLTIQPWVYDFISNTPNSQEETQRTQLLDVAKKVFVKYYKQKERVLDSTSERANKLERERLLEKDEDIVGLELNEKEVNSQSGEINQEVQVESKRFAVLAQHACVAAETALIFGDVREATCQILTANNANRIIAGEAQQKREVALISDQFKDVFRKNATVYKVLGEQSKQAIRESAKIAKILVESQKPIGPKNQQLIVTIGNSGYVLERVHINIWKLVQSKKRVFHVLSLTAAVTQIRIKSINKVFSFNQILAANRIDRCSLCFTASTVANYSMNRGEQ
ncbi:MAG: hypothetical protein EZS28_014811, partial [Streblomastix strix]